MIIVGAVASCSAPEEVPPCQPMETRECPCADETGFYGTQFCDSFDGSWHVGCWRDGRGGAEGYTATRCDAEAVDGGK